MISHTTRKYGKKTYSLSGFSEEQRGYIAAQSKAARESARADLETGITICYGH